MTQLRDLIYAYRLRNGPHSTCRVRLWRNGIRTIVMLTEMPDNPGTSVTNAAEQLVTELVAKYNLSPTLTTFIEHYPGEYMIAHGHSGGRVAETFDRIEFKWSRRYQKATDVEWKRLKQTDIESLIGASWKPETVRAGLEL